MWERGWRSTVLGRAGLLCEHPGGLSELGRGVGVWPEETSHGGDAKAQSRVVGSK